MVEMASLGDCDNAGPSEMMLTPGGIVAVRIVLLFKLCKMVAIPGSVADVLEITSDDSSELSFFFVFGLMTMLLLFVVIGWV